MMKLKQTVLLSILIIFFSNIFLTAKAVELTYFNGIQRAETLYNTLKSFEQIDTVKSIILVNGQHINYSDSYYHKLKYTYDKNYISSNLKNKLNYNNLITELDQLFFEKNPDKADIKTIMMSDSTKKKMIDTPLYVVMDYVYVNKVPFSVVIKFKPFESTYFFETKSVPVGDYGIAYPYTIVEMLLVAGKSVSAESSQLLNIYYFNIMKAYNYKYRYYTLPEYNNCIWINTNNFRIESRFNERGSSYVSSFVKDTNLGVIKYRDWLDYDEIFKKEMEQKRQSIIKEQYSQINRGVSDHLNKI